MREEFNSNGWKDFQQRYLNTYGWYTKDDHSSVLVKVSKVTPEKVVFVDEFSTEYFALSNVGNIFSFLPVQRGLYYYDGTIIYLARIPARQFKRGICQENTLLTNIKTMAHFYISHDLLKNVFGIASNPTIIKFKEAYTGDVLLNKVFAIVNKQVYLYNRKIGEYKNKEVILSNTLFKQELVDVFCSHQMEIAVQ